jgi:osmotically-inducible protein OsmY
LARVEKQRDEDERRGVTGIALSAAAGLGIGLIGGLILHEFLGGVNTEPMRQAVRRIRTSGSQRSEDVERSLDEAVAAREVERAIYEAIAEDPDTQALQVQAEALGDGLIELTGTVPSDLDRQLVAEVARSVAGAEVVVNRILVEGTDRIVSETESESG